jgi:hypothetical protein
MEIEGGLRSLSAVMPPKQKNWVSRDEKLIGQKRKNKESKFYFFKCQRNVNNVRLLT